jgi:predicted RNA-binding Zn-ribbon protein involved in translation (DUF1610 family)
MMAFTTLVGIFVAMAILLRYLRKREIEAFREADMSVFEDFRTVRGRKPADPAAIKAQAPATSNSNVVKLPASESSQPVAPVYELKNGLFDEVHRLFYERLEKVAGAKYRIFVAVPLEDFVRVSQEKTGERILRGRKISFLLCNRNVMSVACGVQLRGAGSEYIRQFDFLQELFRQIEKPLLEFPLINNISEQEIREKLQEVLAESPLTRSCPKCGKEMTMRKAVKGRNSGKTFWVCTEFPSCKGITRIGRFRGQHT